MPAAISTNARNTVATTPVVTGFDLLDWTISALIYIPAIGALLLNILIRVRTKKEAPIL